MKKLKFLQLIVFACIVAFALTECKDQHLNPDDYWTKDEQARLDSIQDAKLDNIDSELRGYIDSVTTANIYDDSELYAYIDSMFEDYDYDYTALYDYIEGYEHDNSKFYAYVDSVATANAYEDSTIYIHIDEMFADYDYDYTEVYAYIDAAFYESINAIAIDSAFEAFLFYEGYDKTLNGYIEESEYEDIQDLIIDDSSIKDLTGIEEFKRLISLRIQTCGISHLDLKLSHTETLIIKDTGIKTITLRDVIKLTSLDIGGCTGLAEFSIINSRTPTLRLKQIDFTKSTLLWYVNLENVNFVDHYIIDLSKTIASTLPFRDGSYLNDQKFEVYFNNGTFTGNTRMIHILVNQDVYATFERDGSARIIDKVDFDNALIDLFDFDNTPYNGRTDKYLTVIDGQYDGYTYDAFKADNYYHYEYRWISY